ncbi:hypothetical protein GH714_017617 [Hevea brasiliensis]|uniref:mitogen-activated protein kinase kinase kinase n=1 Tax=Hevea brasiliensis TaxID=3981 RepID=A0A6A6KW88_HEVBR|nr:hypothetical protein GH714_017617 [Hevea brasiliensis]
MDWTRGHTLGHGSTATVSLAKSIHSGDVWAVKSAELDQSQFLQREQNILSSLTSPHIVSYKGYDITRENNQVMYNLFLEYISGGTLTDAVQAHGGRLEESVIRYYTYEIVQGLDYLHSNGWVHCDIKGRNVLIGKTGAKIADFGCAKRLDAVEAAAESAAPIGGTPLFMAPEVARGEEQGFASDIWALGCTIIEMASGGAPWPNVNDPISVMYRIGFSEQLPEFPCSLSEQARDFLDKCLRRDPKQRWTANQLLKHPFLGESNSHAKQIQKSNSSSNSPTSILDQGFWNSLDESESESENVDNQVQRSDEISAKERIRRLSLLSGGPNWDWDENWTSVRGNYREDRDTVMYSIEDKEDVNSYRSVHQKSYGGSEQSLEDLLDSNINNRISGEFLVQVRPFSVVVL